MVNHTGYSGLYSRAPRKTQSAVSVWADADMGLVVYTVPVALSRGAGFPRSTSEPVGEWWPPNEQAIEYVDRLDVPPGSTTAS
jgi:hypothetical protein